VRNSFVTNDQKFGQHKSPAVFDRWIVNEVLVEVLPLVLNAIELALARGTFRLQPEDLVLIVFIDIVDSFKLLNDGRLLPKAVIILRIHCVVSLGKAVLYSC